MRGKIKKFDVNVSLMRIFACLIVIGCHIRISPVNDEIVNGAVLFIHNFFDDGVSIFFCIIGFFLFNNSSYGKLWKKIFINILVPVILLEGVTALLYNYVCCGMTIGQSINTPSIGLYVFLRDVLSFNYTSAPLSGHLWYITSYIEIIIAFPVLKLIVNEFEKGNRFILNWTIGVGVLGIVLNDIQTVFPFPGGKINTHAIFASPILLCLVGYWIYQKRDVIKGKRVLRMVSFSGMLLINIIRYFAQISLFEQDIHNEYFYYWNTAIACVFSICFIVFFMTFDLKESIVVDIINFLGGQTFGIYLLHMLVFNIIDKYLGRENIVSFFGKGTRGVLLYSVMYPILIFILCLIICSIGTGFKLLWNIFKMKRVNKIVNETVGHN